MIKINPLTGQPEETNDLVDPTNPDAQAAAMLPGQPDMAVGPGGVGGSGPRGVSPADALAAGRAASAGAAAAASGGGPVINIGGKESSTTTERQIVSPRVQAAAEKVQANVEEAQAANTNLQIAEQQKNEAETRVLQATKDAAKEAAEATARQARADLAGRAEAAKELQRKDAEADARIAAAGKQVETDYAATQRGYWKDKPWYYEALAGIAAASSRRNLRTMGEDPNKSGVAAAINKKIEDDKALKFNKYIKSKEFLEDAKKLPGKAREAYSLKLADLQAESAAQLKLVAAEAERLKASADADPEAVATFQQQLLAKAQEANAMAKLQLQKEGMEAAQVANPNVRVSRTNVDAPAGPPPAPAATVADVKAVAGLEKAAEDYEQLAMKAEADPDAWADMQSAVNQHKKEEGRNIRLGPVSVGLGSLERVVGSAVPDSILESRKKAGSRPTVGIDIEDKLRFNPKAQEVYRGVSQAVTQTALGYGGVMRDSDTVRAQIEEGVGSMSAAEFAKSMREKAARIRKEAEESRRQRSFR